MSENFGAKAIREMSPEEQSKLILELAQHAGFVSQARFWRTRNPNDLPEGETIKSIVSLAIEKVFVGDWNWDPVKYSDFKQYLKNGVTDLLFKLRWKSDNRLLRRPPDEESSDFADWHIGSKQRDPTTDWMARHDPTPEEALLAKERSQQEREAWKLLKGEAKDDPLLSKIIQAIERGNDKSREVAAAISEDVNEVYKANKRLGRKVAQVTEKIKTKERKGVKAKS